VETTRLLRARTEKGDSDALFRYGYRLAFGRGVRSRSWKEVARLWKRSARDGHVRAQFYLGTLYDYGNGVRRNLSTAVRWYRSAAEAGHTEGQYNLSLMLRDGKGVEVDRRAAVYWLKCAAEAGDAQAQSDLGVAYFYGEGLRRDRLAARWWYARAARNGCLRAHFNLGLIYANGDGCPKDATKSLRHFMAAARGGHVRSRFYVGEAFETRNAVGDRRRALRWFRRGMYEDPDCMASLGTALVLRSTRRTDVHRALAYMRLAAKNGSQLAMVALAECHEGGIGVERSDEKARRWRRKANG
jgi:hypothetical protein